MFKKLGVYIFPSSPYKRLTTVVKGIRGEEWEGCPSPWPTRKSGGVGSSPSGATNDFGAFQAQFYAISRIFYCI